MASRLSYLLWSSAPDAALLDAAEQDQLGTDELLAAQVDRLLADARSARLADNFAGQWLGARALPARVFDGFPEWTPAVASAAGAEISAWFAELLKPEQQWPRFFDSPSHFVNAHTAPLYGLSLQTEALNRVEIDDSRRGFLSLVGFLAQGSTPASGVSAARGAWLLENLLCQPAEAPEAEALGRALENFDAIGRYRTVDASGAAIDAQVTLPGSAALPSADVDGLPGLSEVLAAAPSTRDCTAQKLYSYAHGRAFVEAERGNVAALSLAWQEGPVTLRELLVHLVQSRPFRQRGDGGAK